ncbi:MAG: hypothetical protein J5I98_03330 [Phaeodactylibacter sp.]|nr:hypothetical protein [Phaeodactylibacter sp.]
MPFKANLEVDSTPFRVLECSYHFERDYDQFGKPSSEVRGGTIDITVETTGTTLFSSWMMSSKLRKSGKIIFEDPTEDAELKVVEFEDAYMVNYEESFGSRGENGMVESFRLSAKKMIIGDGTHENSWYK